MRRTSTSSYPSSPSLLVSLVAVGLRPSLTLSFPYVLLVEVGISLRRVVGPTTFPYASLVEVWILALDLQGKGNKRMILIDFHYSSNLFSVFLDEK